MGIFSRETINALNQFFPNTIISSHIKTNKLMEKKLALSF
jgi:hypothetical protein